MKARVIATGHIVDVELSHYIGDVAWYIDKFNNKYAETDLEFVDAPEDYWIRLEHQYAGMAMQGIVSSYEAMREISKERDIPQYVANMAFGLAHALVERYKKEEK